MTLFNLVRSLFPVLMLAAQALPPVVADSAVSKSDRGRSLLPQSQRELRVVESLQVNTSNQFRTVALDKCEARGLEDIVRLVSNSKFEELWAFIPGDGATDCRWIEIGADHSAGLESAGIKVDWDYLESLMARDSNFYIYHFHPLEYFRRCAPGPGCSARSVPLRVGSADISDLIVNLQYAMPSAEDIYFMSESTWRLDQHHPDGAVMRHRVVSPYGVVEYRLSDQGRQRYAANHGSRMEGLYIKLMAANALVDEHIHNTIQAYPGDLSEALRFLVASMNSANLRVDFVPFD